MGAKFRTFGQQFAVRAMGTVRSSFPSVVS
jgi:hypothetical protein